MQQSLIKDSCSNVLAEDQKFMRQPCSVLDQLNSFIGLYSQSLKAWILSDLFWRCEESRLARMVGEETVGFGTFCMDYMGIEKD